MSETGPNLSGAERELEGALGGLSPRPAGIDLTAVAFAAGRRSARARLVGWRAAAAVLSVALATLALLRPQPQVVERVVTVTVEVPATIHETARLHHFARSDRATPEPAYLLLRNAVLERGLDALPGSSASAPNSRTDIIRASDIYRMGDQL